jgi:formylglycine-generating enzyme required for sulfatase activity
MGSDVNIYREMLAPVLLISASPSVAILQLFKEVAKGKYQEVKLTDQTPPVKQEAEMNATYEIRAAAKGYEPLTKRIRLSRSGVFRVKLKLNKLRYWNTLSRYFESVSGQDFCGNPVRKGLDKNLYLPLDIRHKSSRMHLVLIPPGEFIMGSRGADYEGPMHRVRMTKPYYMGKYEVTRAEWSGTDNRGSNRRPIVSMRWSECGTFFQRLNTGMTLKGKAGFSLPTEAQWEYAHRAGSKTNFHYGDTVTRLYDYAWYRDNSRGSSHDVGTRKPNPWGLYDMPGNVYEWMLESEYKFKSQPQVDPAGASNGPNHYIRGGAFNSPSNPMRPAYRGHKPVGYRDYAIGVRAVFNLDTR